MPTKLQQRVLDTLREHRMFQPGDRVAVAASGGADSVALLLLLEELRVELGITLLVAHFNHQLRGESAEADEQFVRDLADSHNLEFFCAREDVAAESRRLHANLEEVARQRRYEFFSGLVEAGRATRVAVGHTADDQAETVLARLVRGTGPLGLAGIYPVLGHVVRPLLGVRRQELREYLIARGQSWREDRTNLDTTRLRARIRQQLLPPLERDFSPAIVSHLGTLAELARADEAFWNALIEDRFRALVEQGLEGLAISVADLLAPIRLEETGLVASSEAFEESGDLHRSPGTGLEALTWRLIRRIVEGAKGDRRRLTARHVRQILRLARESSSGHQVHLPRGLVVERRFDRLQFLRAGAAPRGLAKKETAAQRASYSYAVDLPRQGAVAVEIAEIGKRVCLKVIDWPAAASDTYRLADVLDADLLRPPLVLRNWLPGDAYRPKGRRHARKLKRLLLESRIPARERIGWLVLTSAGRLVWARGLPAAQDFAASAGTRTGLVIAEEAR